MAQRIETTQAAVLESIVLPEKIVIPLETEQTLFVSTATNSTIVLEEGAHLTFILFCTEGWSETAKLTFEFSGKNSSLQFLAMMIGKGKNHFPFETISRHIVPQTKAHYFVRAAMFDDSLVDYKGNIIIEKEAQLTDTYLAHHTLLLSDRARARTIPALEIEADDVKAGHAATIGKVDEELMFYLQSRGIATKEAEQMLISGFFEDQLKLVHDEKIQLSLRELILKNLPTTLLQ